MVDYIQSAAANTNLSQLMQAELLYLFFKEDEMPIFYDMEADLWWVFDYYWRASKNNMTRVKARYHHFFFGNHADHGNWKR